MRTFLAVLGVLAAITICSSSNVTENNRSESKSDKQLLDQFNLSLF